MIPSAPVVLTKVCGLLEPYSIYWTGMGSAGIGESLKCGLTHINLCIFVNWYLAKSRTR